MPPNNYNLVQTESIELLVPGEHHLEDQHKRSRHGRSNSTTSFIHFRAPQQKEEDSTITNVSQLASQVSNIQKKKIYTNLADFH